MKRASLPCAYAFRSVWSLCWFSSDCPGSLQRAHPRPSSGSRPCRHGLSIRTQPCLCPFLCTATTNGKLTNIDQNWQVQCALLCGECGRRLRDWRLAAVSIRSRRSTCTRSLGNDRRLPATGPAERAYLTIALKDTLANGYEQQRFNQGHSIWNQIKTAKIMTTVRGSWESLSRVVEIRPAWRPFCWIIPNFPNCNNAGWST